MGRLTIRTQAYLVGVLPLIFLLALLALSFVMASTSQTGAALEQRTQFVLGELDRTRATLTDADRAGARGSASSDVRFARDRAALNAEFNAIAETVQRQPGLPARVTQLRNTVGAGMNVIQSYGADVRAGNTAAAQAVLRAASTRSLSGRLTAEYDGVVSRERAFEIAQINHLRTVQRQSELTLITVCLLGIITALLVSGRFGLRIAHRLAHLAENARRLARGEAAETLAGNDEFAALDRVYQEMMQRIAREQSISAALQRSLLPQELPRFDGIRIDTAYVPAAQEWEVGGDWYDVFTISERQLCISIGDVAGHGLRAATLMAGARLAVRTAARVDTDPGVMMTHVNRVLCADEPGTLITACVATLDLESGLLQYAIAGHPEPLVIRADREIEFLSGNGLLLGADPVRRYETFEANLHEGWALLLYTDGLVEIEHDYFQGVDDLCAAAYEEVPNCSENIAEAIQRRVFRGRRASDDAAILFIGVTRLGRTAGAQRKWVLDARDAQSARRAKRAILWYLGNEIRDEEHLAAAESRFGRTHRQRCTAQSGNRGSHRGAARRAHIAARDRSRRAVSIEREVRRRVFRKWTGTVSRAKNDARIASCARRGQHCHCGTALKHEFAPPRPRRFLGGTNGSLIHEKLPFCGRFGRIGLDPRSRAKPALAGGSGTIDAAPPGRSNTDPLNAYSRA